jgi:hypothetical protein
MVLAPEVTDSSIPAGDTLAKVFLKAIQTTRTLPREVRVRSQKLKDSLAPLMEPFGVRFMLPTDSRPQTKLGPVCLASWAEG